MLLCARLVVLVLLFINPQVSFGIPPSFLQGRKAPALLTGDWVAEQIDKRDTGKDARSTLQMRLYDRQNRLRERTLTLLALEGGDSDRLLIRFNYPNDIAGTSFLVWERAGADDERFLYLPALGRVRRIAGAERQESFVGSDFTYEDIGGRALEDYTYTLQANATYAAADGQSYPVYVLESRAKDADALYPRVVSHVRQDNFVVVRAEIFNRRNEREKEYRVERLDQVEGIWTARTVLMTNELAHTRTELTMTSVDYNVGLKESDFSRRELERGTR
jgi:hypothetical protein